MGEGGFSDHSVCFWVEGEAPSFPRPRAELRNVLLLFFSDVITERLLRLDSLLELTLKFKQGQKSVASVVLTGRENPAMGQRALQWPVFLRRLIKAPQRTFSLVLFVYRKVLNASGICEAV